MAKGKHSAALFEVIHSDKRFRNKTAALGHGSLKTPKWWFKGRDKTEESAPTPANEITPVELAADPTLATSTTSTEPAPKPVKLHPERNEISFKLTYTNAIIGAFSVAVIVSLAYMIGTRGKSTPAAARAGQSTESLMKHPAQTGVLNLESNSTKTPDTAKKSSPSEADASPRATPAPPVVSGQNAQQPAEPQAADDNDAERPVIGLNYVIAQSYPDQKDAERAAAALNERGLGAWVVSGPKNYAPMTWSSVVGKRGFDRIKNSPEHDAYVQQIVEIGALFKNDRKFKELKPRPYKWQGDH
ncbi:MAG: hypothetical protein H0T11_06885 [Chthoniobacterales bacterium]|nr:hypothetical protein [Chthoniobacterales bacterium]